MINEWLLPLLILIPFAGGLISWGAGKVNIQLPKWIALLTMAITLVIALGIWCSVPNVMVDNLNSPVNWYAKFSTPWISSFNINFTLAVDGISLLMVVLTAFLGLFAVTCSWKEINRDTGAFNLNLLWSLGAVIGLFIATDLFLFFFFWELMLVPIYFMVAIWGYDSDDGKSRKRAALKFFIYTQVTGLILLVGIFALVFNFYSLTGVISFDYDVLLHNQFMNPVFGFLVMLCFFIGFVVKLPIIPLHGWMADMHAHSPTAGSVDIAGILIKTAPYGLLRFTIPLFPEASVAFAPYAIALGFITLFYGAWLAFSQSDIKRLLAYTTVSHMGILLIGLYSGSIISLQGVMVMMIAQGVTSTGLFILAGQIFERYQTRDLTVLSGLWGSLRYLPAFLMFFAAALLGLPGTGDFIGEIFVLFGTFTQWPWVAALISFSMVFAGLYSLILIHKALFGAKMDKPALELCAREKLMLAILAIVVIWIGIAPQTILNTSHSTMQWIDMIYNAAGGAL